jgi:glycosyltransferase 2 family protein
LSIAATRARLPWAVRLVMLLVFATLFLLAAHAIDWPRLARELAGAKPLYVAAMLAAWSAVLFLRPLRMLLLLRAVVRPIPGDYRAIWAAHVIGLATNSIVPMRGGDLVMAVIFRRRLGVSVPQALSVILVDRVCDTVAVAIIFLGALLFLPTAAPWSRGLALALIVGLVAGFTAIALIVRMRIAFLAWLAERFARSERGMRWHRLAEGLLSGLGTFRTVRFTAVIVLISVMLWGATVLSYWVGIRAVIDGVPVAAAAFAVGAVALSFIVPLAPGGIGVFHAATVFALSAFGVPVEPALAFAIIAHALQLLSVLAIAGITLLVIGLDPRAVIRQREDPS